MIIEEARSTLDRALDLFGSKQEDKRLHRLVMRLIGHSICLDYKAPRNIKTKYLADFSRMRKTFNEAVKNARKNPGDRRLVVFNTKLYSKTYQCFLLFHFVLRNENEYDVIIYQRSADMEKFKDDAKFFMFVAKEWKDKLKCKIFLVKVFYGHLHKQIN